MTTFGAAPTKAPLSVTRPSATLKELIESVFAEDLIAAAGHGSLSEDLALALLNRRDLPAPAVETLARNPSAIKHRKVLVDVVQHLHTPRHVSLPLLRRLFVFELMQVVLTPSVAADLKLIAEELLINKLETLSLGERINLARRASTGVAGALLLHSERAVIEASLQNPRMTEAGIMRCFGKRDIPMLLLTMLSEHPKWSLSREIQIAIVRRPEAKDAIVLRIAAKLPKPVIYQMLKQLKLPERRQELLARTSRPLRDFVQNLDAALCLGMRVTNRQCLCWVKADLACDKSSRLCKFANVILKRFFCAKDLRQYLRT